MPFAVGDQVYITGAAGDHGAQAWADAWALQSGSTPVTAKCFYLGLRGYDTSLATVPPGEFSQLIRLKDGARLGGIAPLDVAGPNHWWTSIAASVFFDPLGSGRSAWFTKFPTAVDGVSPPNNIWPDGSFVRDGAPSDGYGALIVLLNCDGAPGDGGSYEDIVPYTAFTLGIVHGSSGFGSLQWNLQYSISTSSKCPGGGGGGGDDGPPLDNPSGIDVLCWKEGYHIAQAGNNAIQVTGRWHPEQGASAGLIPTAKIDTGAEFWEPKLAHPPWGPPLSVTYRKQVNTSQTLWRKESYDYGQTWISDPPGGGAYKPVKHGVEVWNGRTGERVALYNDGTALGSDGKPNGKGAIKADVYGPQLDANTGLLKFIATYPVTEPGALADDSSFGAIWITELGAIDCVVMVAQAARTYRSLDDARTWIAS